MSGSGAQERTGSVVVWKGLGGASATPGIYVWCPACGDAGAPPAWVPDSKHGHVLLVELQLEHLTHRGRPAPAPAPALADVSGRVMGRG